LPSPRRTWRFLLAQGRDPAKCARWILASGSAARCFPFPAVSHLADSVSRWHRWQGRSRRSTALFLLFPSILTIALITLGRPPALRGRLANLWLSWRLNLTKTWALVGRFPVLDGISGDEAWILGDFFAGCRPLRCRTASLNSVFGARASSKRPMGLPDSLDYVISWWVRL